MRIINKSILLTTALLLNACAKQQAGTVISQQDWQQATNKVHHQYADEVAERLRPYFVQANLSYPPKEIAMLTFKNEQVMELWAREQNTKWHHIKNYPLTAFSGKLGPKLVRNDGQIPEGIYKITKFNPFSSQHLSMMLNYPNQFDRLHGKQDGRIDLGDNIFIHGKAKSVGCLAIGDQAIDDLFVLVKEVGKENTKVIIAPKDFRKNQSYNVTNKHPKWVPSLYQSISQQLLPFSA